MYDNEFEDETQAGAEPSEWEIPDLPLELKGEKGSVQFRSLEELSGGQLDNLRSRLGQAKNDGDMANTYYLEAATILITGWDIPGNPTLPIPKGDPKSWRSISFVTRRQIERHMQQKLDPILSNKAGRGDPTGPASE